MELEQRLNEYLLSKIADGTFLEAKLVGLFPEQNGGRAIVVKKYFTEGLEKYIVISEIDGNFTFSYVNNPVQEGTKTDLELQVEHLKSMLEKLTIIQIESLTKDINSSQIYSEEKTNLIFDSWRYLIENSTLPVDNDIVEGLKYYETPDTELNAEQIIQKKKVLDWKNKLTARNRIEVEVGDTSDLLADVSKRVSMNERLLIRLAHQILTGTEMSQDFKNKYTQFLGEYLYVLDNNLFKDRTDLEDEAALFTRLMGRFNNITTIVKEEYLDKV